MNAKFLDGRTTSRLRMMRDNDMASGWSPRLCHKQARGSYRCVQQERPLEKTAIVGDKHVNYSGAFLDSWQWVASGASSLANYPGYGVSKGNGLCATLTFPGVNLLTCPDLAHTSDWQLCILSLC